MNNETNEFPVLAMGAIHITICAITCHKQSLEADNLKHPAVEIVSLYTVYGEAGFWNSGAIPLLA